MKPVVRFIIIAAVVVAGCVPVAAQDATAPYKFDLGAGLGMSGYIGDVNSSNPFAHPGFTADLRFGYLIDTRWALRASLGIQGLSGSTEDIANVLPSGELHRSFTSQVYDLGVRGEFNFLPYGIGETYKRLRRWTPYLAAGVGVSMSSSSGNTAAGFSIPMAFGFKFKLKERVNLYAEFSMTKVFNDNIDGKDFADLNHIKTDFYKSTDWFSRLTVGIT
ncbi:MAG: porin family protein, partial [Muribaculaceae bacterium]|nr:porin family protein [Muribaculaceae bacterium]